jgi:hypothetical protein
MAAKLYKKIGGRGRPEGESFTWNTLWLGPDHLLHIEHSGYTETYKRFYYNEIQAITIRETKRLRNWSIFFLVMITIFASLALAIGDQIGRVFMLIFLALFLILLVINLIKGKTCICHVQTAVHREALPSLRRVRNTRKALVKIREQIAAAQGLFSPEEARARYAAGEHLHNRTSIPALPPKEPNVDLPPPL